MDLIEKVKLAPELPMGNELETIFKFQNEIEYVNTLFSPVHIKKMGNKISYYLSEAFEYHYLMIHGVNNNVPDINNKALELIYKTNLSYSKALNALIKFMASCNIGPDDILNYYETLLNELNLSDAYLFKENTLQTCMQYARHNNIQERIYNNPDINLRPIILDKPVDDNFIKACRVKDPYYLSLLSQQSWMVTYSIQRSFAQLPTDIEKDSDPFQKKVMEVWLYFFKLMDLLGHNDDSIGRIYSVYYYLKNQ